MQPTARTLKVLRADGWQAQVVEQWISYTKQRRDLFGVIDILAVRGSETLGVQCTSDSNMSARINKSVAEPKLRQWLNGPRRFEVWGWGKKGKAGKQKLWQVRREVITLDDLADAAQEERMFSAKSGNPPAQGV